MGVTYLRALIAVSVFAFAIPRSQYGIAHAFDYDIKVTAPSSVYAGSDAYILLRLTPIRSSYVGNLYVYFTFTSVRMSNGPIPYTVICRTRECNKDKLGRYYDDSNNGVESVVTLRLAVSSSMPPDPHVVSVSVEAGGASKNVSVPLQVKPQPAAVARHRVIGAPSIPGLSRWQRTMISLGKKWCSPTATYGFGVESQVWYYDGARVFFQIADYTEDDAWEACAFNIARQYRDYVIKNNGGIPGWRVFSQGLRMAYERSGDSSYREAMKLLTKHGVIVRQTNVGDSAIRETAYAVELLIDLERIGEPRSRHLARLVDYLLGHYDRLFVANDYELHQTFFDGLAAESLIQYYELTGDLRIPPTIKAMLDWMWDYGWDKAAHKMVYNPDPVGPKCSSLCQQYLTDLINLVAPAYAWYWRITGSQVYLARGDELFEHALDEDISWNGKIFSQNYRWSFDYVRWRTPGRFGRR
jgi:hypothetical protein